MHMMEHGERAEADAGYTGLPEHITMPVDARAPNGRSIPRRSSGLLSAGVFLSQTLHVGLGPDDPNGPDAPNLP